MSDHIKIADANGVRTLTISRPEKKNAITRDMYLALAAGLAGAQAEPSVRVVLITGEGPAFTAGNDLVDFLEHPPTGEEPGPPPQLVFLHALLEADKPVAAAVNGLAVGIGVTMLLHCDLVWAAEGATFRTPFTDLGLVPEAASSLLLPAQIGKARANELLLLGEIVTAREALHWGLVSRVFPDAALAREALARCEMLARKAPAAVRSTKRLVRGDVEAARARMAEEAALFAERLGSEEFREAARAFIERRTPDFGKFS